MIPLVLLVFNVKMAQFFLYDILKAQKAVKLTLEEKTNIVRAIESLDQDGQNKVFALIAFHYREKECPIPEEIVEFDFNKFPLELQNILKAFCTRHLLYMKEKDLNKCE